MNTNPCNILNRTARAALCASASLLAASLFAQADTHADTTTEAAHSTAATGKLKHADRSFVEKAAKSGMEEVEISRIVAERSTNADVKKFAQMMVDDHSKANDQLTSLATTKGVKLPEKEKNENKWAKKDAKDLDRDYVKKMVSDHKDDIKLFTKESQDGADSDLVDFARKTLPTLQQHLEAANNLNATVR